MMNLRDIKVLGKRILIKPVEHSNTTTHGIVLVDETLDKQNGHTRKGVVIQSNVSDVPLGVTVYYSQFVGVEYKEYVILEEKEVLAYTEEEN